MQTHSRLIPSLAATVLLLAGIAAGRAYVMLWIYVRKFRRIHIDKYNG